MKYVVMFKGAGKRIKRGKYMRPMVLYGQKFVPHARVLLTDEFKEEAGLGNPDTEPAILLSLKTDFGIMCLKKISDQTDVTPEPVVSKSDSTTKPDWKTPPFSSTSAKVEFVVEPVTEETEDAGTEKLDVQADDKSDT